MAILNIQEEDKDRILSLIKLSLREEVFPDWEFSTLIGERKNFWEDLLKDPKWINWDDENFQFFVNNIINNLLWYPHWLDDTKIKDFSGLNYKELWNLFEKFDEEM
jgi:hypothetical protein